MLSENSLIHVWNRGIESIDPVRLFDSAAKVSSDTAVLCWGKAAFRTWVGLQDRVAPVSPVLLIGPRGGKASAGGLIRLHPLQVFEAEHPLPGPGSRGAGKALVEFFDELRRLRIRRLEVYLSGGASSLAWLAPAHWSAAELEHAWVELYAAPLTIRELNRRRKEFCLLKGGGAARILGTLAPRVHARVHVLSDVHPFGAEVVGSGPFWDGEIPHRIAADNGTLVRRLGHECRTKGIPVLQAGSMKSCEWTNWVRKIELDVRIATQNARAGIMIWGGEPRVDLAGVRSPGRGGRQTQIAAALGAKWAPRISSGEIEVLCMSSDGVDGRSGAAGAHLDRSVGAGILRKGAGPELLRACRRLDSATALRKLGALLPERPSGTNVQDVVMVRIRAGASSRSSRTKST